MSSYKRTGGMQKDREVVYTNDKIKAFTIMVIDEEGTRLGEFPRREALQMAEDKGLDLVQVTYDPKKKVCTAKIVDMGKYAYEKKKQTKEKRKQQKQQSRGIKEIKISYSIGEHDVQMKVVKAEELLKDGYNVKLYIRLKGRERSFAGKAKEKLQKMSEELQHIGKPQYKEPQEERSGYWIILSPLKGQNHGKSKEV